MRLLAFSDLHCDKAAASELVAAAPDADLIIGAGDFASAHRGLERTMEAIRPLEPKALYVPGNNETLAALRGATSAPVLHGQSYDHDGVKIAGIGGAVPPLPPLAWDSWDLSEETAAALLAPMAAADILITHSPPQGVADRLEDGRHVGSVAVRAWIEAVQPALVLCGHIHGCWGESGQIGASKVHNLGPGCSWFDL